MKQGHRVGYVRVSSVDQNTARQLEDVELDRVFEDRLSGKDTKRPQLDEMLKYVREGDTVVVHSMDRLARNLDDLRRLVRDMTNRKVRVEFRKEGFVFTGEDSPMANLMLSMIGAVAEFERSMIRERQREGVAIAKREGRFKGRLPSLTAEQLADLRHRVEKRDPKAAIARDLGISRATLYAYLGSEAPNVRKSALAAKPVRDAYRANRSVRSAA